MSYKKIKGSEIFEKVIEEVTSDGERGNVITNFFGKEILWL